MSVQDQMVMIAHHSVDTDVDRKNVGQFSEFIHYSLFAMFVALAREFVFATEKGTANTARNAMVIRG